MHFCFLSDSWCVIGVSYQGQGVFHPILQIPKSFFTLNLIACHREMCASLNSHRCRKQLHNDRRGCILRFFHQLSLAVEGGRLDLNLKEEEQ